jgi:hypothetical protein
VVFLSLPQSPIYYLPVALPFCAKSLEAADKPQVTNCKLQGENPGAMKNFSCILILP